MEELDRLFQPPLLPQSRCIQDPLFSAVLCPHPCKHDGGRVLVLPRLSDCLHTTEPNEESPMRQVHIRRGDSPVT